jgi:hypothetical protein
MKKIKLSRTGVTHAFEDADMTICAREIPITGSWTTDPEVTCKTCLKVIDDLKRHAAPGSECHELCEVHPKPVKASEPTGEPIKPGAMAQSDGASVGRAGKALMGNCSWSGESARLAFTHGWMTHHVSCDCKISGGFGYTFDLATHTMVKNPPARQYTRAELDRAARRKGYVPASWRSKHKGSKAARIRSHA